MTEDYDSDVVRFSQTKRFCPYKYMCDFQKFKEKLPDNSEFHVSFSGKGVSDIEYQHALEVWNKFEMKTKKDYQICTQIVMFYCLLICLKNLEIDAKTIMVVSKSLFVCNSFKLECNAQYD